MVTEKEIQDVLALGKKACKDPASFTKEERLLYHNTYYKIFTKRKPHTCSTCLTEIFFEIKSIFNPKTKTIMTKNCKFALKPDAVIGFHGVSEDYTNANLDDRGALSILKRSKGCIKFFEKYPDNWEELVNQFDLTMKDEEVAALVGSPSQAAPAGGANTGGDASGEDAGEDPIKKALIAKTKAMLYDQADEMQLPKEEWKGKNKAEMVEYLFGKISSAE